jgi:hypothetical protein
MAGSTSTFPRVLSQFIVVGGMDGRLLYLTDDTYSYKVHYQVRPKALSITTHKAHACIILHKHVEKAGVCIIIAFVRLKLHAHARHHLHSFVQVSIPLNPGTADPRRTPRYRHTHSAR